VREDEVLKKEVISDKQGITMVILFILGSSLILGTSLEAKRDAWIAILMAIAAAVPVYYIYARLISLFPGYDLFDILSIVFGKIGGKIISLLFIWYAFHLGSLVLRNFGEFITEVSLDRTPMIVLIVLLSILCIWGVKEGIELMGRWGEFFLLFVIISILATTLLLIPKYNINRILPVLYNGFGPVLRGGFSSFSFPFAEVVVFLMAFCTLKRKTSSYKIYFWGLAFGGLIIFTGAFRNILVLGDFVMTDTYFPSYLAARRINVGNFVQRLEILIAIVFLLTGFIKICICLLAVSKGIAKFTGLDDYRFIVTPTGLLMANLSYLVYKSTMEMEEWALMVYPYYAFPFQVILPLIILIAAEIRMRSPKFKKRLKGTTL
jgi:spore germination protein KB